MTELGFDVVEIHLTLKKSLYPITVQFSHRKHEYEYKHDV